MMQHVGRALARKGYGAAKSLTLVLLCALLNRGFWILSRARNLDLSWVQSIPLRPYAGNKKLRIAFWTATLGAGGAERQMATLARELKERGHEVQVYCEFVSGPNGHYLPLLEQVGIPVTTTTRKSILQAMIPPLRKNAPINFLRYLHPVSRIRALALVYHMVQQDLPDVLHCYLDGSNITGGIVGIALGIPCIRLSTRSYSPRLFPAIFGNSLDWVKATYQLLLQTGRVHMEANSTHGRNDYADWLGISPKFIDYIPNGISPDFFHAATDDDAASLRTNLQIPLEAPVVACVLRMTEEKRPLSVIEVAERTRRLLPDACFLWAGGGPMELEVREKIAAYGLQDTVRLLGRRDDVPALLQASDALLLTSRIEGMPNVIMEAMLAGTPVVSSEVGGVPDLAIHGEHGFLYDKDDWDGMAKGLAVVLGDAALRSKMGTAAQERIRNDFSVQMLADRVLERYYAKLGRHMPNDKESNS